MADVSRDRGQLLVVGAIALAVSLVAVGLVLNFAIYTENLATREGNSGAASIVHEQQAAIDGVGRAMEYVNSHNATEDATPAEINASLQEQIAALNDSLTDVGAVTGASVRVTNVNPHVGTRLAQSNASRNYTSAGAATEWNLVDGAPEVSRFTMRIWRPSLTDKSSVSLTDTLDTLALFQVNVTDADGETWRTYIYRDSTTDTAYLATADPGNSFGGLGNVLKTCMVEGRNNVTVDFVEGTFGATDRPCEELSYWNSADPPLTVEYVDADQAAGTYEILLNSSDYTEANFNDVSTGDSPFAHNATFSARTTFRYVGNDVRYTDTTTVSPIPNVTKFPGLAPEVLQFDVADDTDAGDDAVSFAVDWHVRDADGDLRHVNVSLIDEANSEIDDEVTNSYSGLADASGAPTLSGSGSDSWSVRIVAVDANGNVVVRTVSKNDRT